LLSKNGQHRKNSTPDKFLGPKFGSDLQNLLLHNSIGQIFDYLVFAEVWACFQEKLGKNPKSGFFA
jgi:hypothetical protein